MNYIHRLAERNKQNPDHLICALLGLIGLALFATAMIIATTIHIHAFSKTPTIISGRLQEVNYSYQSSLELHVDGDIYVLRKESKYSSRTFGLRENMTLRAIRDVLDKSIGREIHLKYLNESGKNRIVQLSIDGVDYIDENLAVTDFIGLENTTRWIGIAILFISILLFVLIWKGIIR